MATKKTTKARTAEELEKQILGEMSEIRGKAKESQERWNDAGDTDGVIDYLQSKSKFRSKIFTEEDIQKIRNDEPDSTLINFIDTSITLENKAVIASEHIHLSTGDPVEDQENAVFLISRTKSFRDNIVNTFDGFILDHLNNNPVFEHIHTGIMVIRDVDFTFAGPVMDSQTFQPVAQVKVKLKFDFKLTSSVPKKIEPKRKETILEKFGKDTING